MKTSYWRRLAALIIDFLLILLYACALFALTYLFTNGESVQVSPYIGQLIAFVTLTLPVLGCFIYFEYTNKNGTPGKQLLKLKVVAHDGTAPALSSVVIRNIVKLLPWEIAHAFVQALFYFLNSKQEAPAWVMAGLIFPQLLVFLYMLYPLLHKQGLGFNDVLARTKVVSINT